MVHSKIFTPHGVCLLWSPSLIGLDVLGNVLVALSYFTIPVALLVAARRCANPRITPFLVLFGMFIFFCGGGHVIDIWNIWHADYWFKAWWTLVGTSAFSIGTAAVVLPRMGLIADLLSRKVDYSLIVAVLEREQKELEGLRRDYEGRADRDGDPHRGGS